MQQVRYYESPLGKILLAADEAGLVGIWFEGQKYEKKGLKEQYEWGDSAVLDQTVRWLDLYFRGKHPKPSIPIHWNGTEFQQKVWKILTEIPYGETTTYGAIAKKLTEQYGDAAMSSQAVGGAVGRNPIAILVPCHRVVGAKGQLTGYAGGLSRKELLLRLEKGVGCDNLTLERHTGKVLK
ncbi:MAG: methylated-DNA--[protein]-cysteine S-methyltransferase [Eubacteriales bacterium]|nr:methylated-DNA--[protein]-cysteine S-methyltransferase [Eubacteriales bacterium]